MAATPKPAMLTFLPSRWSKIAEAPDVKPWILFGLGGSKIFNSYTTDRQGDFRADNNILVIFFRRMSDEKNKRIVLESLVTEMEKG